MPEACRKVFDYTLQRVTPADIRDFAPQDPGYAEYVRTFLEILARYHAAVIAAVDESCGAREGVARLIRAHLEWVVKSRREARYLFEISRSEWTEEIRGAQRAQNSRLAEAVERWRAPLVARGELLPMTSSVFFSQIIGPAQIFCRAWLSGRDRADPGEQADILIACAIRAVVAPDPIYKPGETV